MWHNKCRDQNMFVNKGLFCFDIFWLLLFEYQLQMHFILVMNNIII